MDPAVGDQGLDRHPGDLAADAVESRQHDRLRRVVDYHVDAGEVLERPDVAALAADDPALEVVGGQLDDRDGGLGGVRGGRALDRDREHVAGAPVGLEPRLLVDPADHPGRVGAGLVLDPGQELVPRLAGGQPGDPLQLGELTVADRLELVLQLLGMGVAIGDRLLAPAQLLQPGIDLSLAGDRALLDLGQLRPPRRELALELRLALELFRPGCHLRLAHLLLRLPTRIREHPLRRRFRVGQPAGAQLRGPHVSGDQAQHEREQDQQHLHRVPPS